MMTEALLMGLPFFFGYILDLIIGDPKFLYHPVRLIGLLIDRGETIIRRWCNTKRSEYVGGMVLTILVVGVSFVVPFAVLYLAAKLHPYARLFVETIFCYQILATKSLKDESMPVYDALKNGDIQAARTCLSWIVGRDTKDLSEAQMAKATVETIAENTSDGVIAPMIWLAIGGAPLGFLYKAVNTLDSMIGYKNERYLYFGRFAARLDDVVNFVPSRLAAMLMLCASKLIGLDTKNGVKIYKRDRLNHSSPNSAQTESVCAGALNVQLAGDAYYFGALVKKPTIGDDNRPIEADDIRVTNRLMVGTSLLGFLVFGVIRWFVINGVCGG